jgi:hypothetical protein
MEVAQSLAYLYHGSVQNSSAIDIVPLLFVVARVRSAIISMRLRPRGAPKIARASAALPPRIFCVGLMHPYPSPPKAQPLQEMSRHPLECGRCKLVSLVWTRRGYTLVKRILPFPSRLTQKRVSVSIAIIAASLTRPAYAQTLDDQKRCAAQAEKAFQTFKSEGLQLASAYYSSHYNTKFQKCLMLIGDVRPGRMSMVWLTDAFERRTYASIAWFSSDKPMSCVLIPTSREKRYCATREEFDDFVAGYME